MRSIHSRLKVAWLLTLLTLLAAFPQLSRRALTLSSPVVDEIISGCSQAGAKRITVADFTDLQGQVTELGRFVAEELSTSLVMAKAKFGVIDRANLRTILAEHKLSMSGLVNPDTAKKLGQIAGVDGIVTGTITPLGESVKVSVKVIATDTATIIAAARSEMAKTRAIEELMNRGVEATRSTAEERRGPTGVGTSEAARQQGGVIEAIEKEFRFALQSCQRLGSGVRCQILISNMGGQTSFTIFSQGFMQYSRAFDDSGNEYPLKRLQLGSADNPGIMGITLLRGVPVRATLHFESVEAGVSKFTAVDISGFAQRAGEYRTQLLNVPIR
jgi:TolB-like protein